MVNKNKLANINIYYNYDIVALLFVQLHVMTVYVIVIIA